MWYEDTTILVYIDSGNTTIVTGNVKVTANNAYGGYLVSNTAVITLGEEGSGVNTTTPSLRGTGTTSGYGISKGQGEFYLYDGNVMGTTECIVNSALDLPTHTEDNYYPKISTYTDPDTGIEYHYCDLDVLF